MAGFTQNSETLIHEGDTVIGYVTDLEGNWDYWNEYLKISKVLRRAQDDSLEFVDDRSCFVHGGDVVDRGNGDIRILKDLIRLYDRYPNRVFFIVGNRDVNKLRFWFSLHPNVLRFKPEAFWVAENQIPADFPLNNKIEKLKWVLKATMGAPFAYECHRQELSEFLEDHVLEEDKIYNSFLLLIHPTNEENLVFQYLERGKMSVILGDTMFVHGAVTSFQLGYVPPSRNEDGQMIPEQHCSDPFQWTQLINQFMKNELDDYKRNFTAHLAKLDACQSLEELRPLLWDSTGDYHCDQPGSRLVQCGMGALKNKATNPGVIYASYLNNGKPVRIEPSVKEWLQNIRNVIVGHQPNGDTPLIMNHLDVKTISADSSYSKFLMWPMKDLVKAVEQEKEHIVPLAPSTSSSISPKRARTETSPTPSSARTILTEEDLQSEEFMPIEKFWTTKLGQTLALASSPSAQANTRSHRAVNEVLLVFSSPLSAVIEERKNTAISATVLVHGRISLGAEYVSNVSVDPYVGRETVDGWWVKTANVRFPKHVEDSSSGNGSAVYYLLAQSEKFDFRSKLIPREDMSRLQFV